MSCGIYKITNKINNHSYIGQSINIENRWSKEKSRAFNFNSDEYDKTLSRAFRKYGLNNFTWEILEECSKKELDQKEKYYISIFNTYFDGYNETTGGQDGCNSQSKISKQQLLEIYDLLQNSNIPQKDIAKQFDIGQDVVSTINHGKSRRLEGYIYPLRNNYKIKRYCCDCGKELSGRISIRCDTCNHISNRKVDNRPDKNELKKLIRTKSFTSIGKKFGVSDNSIRKWCKGYNLPTTKKEINSYSEQEWNLL